MKEEDKKGQEKTGGWGLTILALVFLGAAIFFFVSRFSFWAGLPALIGAVVALIFAIWLEWAPKDFILGINQEGDIMMVVRAGKVWKFFLQWQGWHFATQGEVQQGEALRRWDVILDKEEVKRNWLREILGGLVFVGIPPFQQVLTYRFKWAHLHEDGSVHHHEKVLNYAFAKWDMYVIEIKGIEDKNGLPLDITILLPMRIVNPYEAFFVVGRWLVMVTGLLQVPLRRFIGSCTYQELLAMQGADTTDPAVNQLERQLWAEVEDALGEEQEKSDSQQAVTWDDAKIRIFGIEIDKLRAGFNSIDPPESYRKLTTKQYEASQEAEAVKIKGEAAGLATAKRVTIAVMAIARQLAGYQPEQELSPDEWLKVGKMTDQAYQYWLTSQGLESIKSSDKIIITGGGQQVGADVAGLTIQEAVRQEIGKKVKEENKEKKED